MKRKEIMYFAVTLVWIIFGFNYLATKFFWYFSTWWFDMPMHFAGGVFLALGTIYCLKITTDFKRELLTSDIILVLTYVFIIALLWELLEYTLSLYGGDPIYLLDMISDLCFGVAGGVLALLIHINGFKRGRI